MIRAMRLLNAVEAGTTSGAQLETLLTADPGRLAEFNVLLGMRGQTRRMTASSTAMAAVAASSTAITAVAASSTAMTAVNANDQAVRIWMLAGTNQVWSNFASVTAVAASSTAMAAVIASSTAMTAVAASSTAMAAVIASSTAMTAVAASSTAMTAVAASSTAMAAVIASSTAMTAVWAADAAADAVLTSATARLAVYNSDTALAALQATPAQVQRKVTSGATNTSTASSSFIFVPNSTKVILLRRYYNSTECDMIDWARGSTSAAVGQGPAGGGRNLDTGEQALGCVSGSYTSNGLMPTTNDAAANFVSAANGLKRRAWSNGNTLYVSYIVV